MKFLGKDVAEVEKPGRRGIALLRASQARNFSEKAAISVLAQPVELYDLGDVDIGAGVVKEAVVALSSQVIRLDVLS